MPALLKTIRDSCFRNKKIYKPLSFTSKSKRKKGADSRIALRESNEIKITKSIIKREKKILEV